MIFNNTDQMVPRSDSCLIVCVYLSKLCESIKTWRLLTGEGVLRMVTDETLLVKDSAIATEEGPPLVGHLPSLQVLQGVADVEHLAVVQSVRVVAVGLALAAETVHIRTRQNLKVTRLSF